MRGIDPGDEYLHQPSDVPFVYRAPVRRWRRFVYRDAVSGQFVTKAYAAAHPRETVRERVR